MKKKCWSLEKHEYSGIKGENNIFKKRKKMLVIIIIKKIVPRGNIAL